LRAVWIWTAHSTAFTTLANSASTLSPGGVYESAVVLLDQAIDYSAMRGQGSDRRLFVLPHEATVAMDVGAEDSGELAFHIHLSAHHPL